MYCNAFSSLCNSLHTPKSSQGKQAKVVKFEGFYKFHTNFPSDISFLAWRCGGWWFNSLKSFFIVMYTSFVSVKLGESIPTITDTGLPANNREEKKVYWLDEVTTAKLCGCFLKLRNMTRRPHLTACWFPMCCACACPGKVGIRNKKVTNETTSVCQSFADWQSFAAGVNSWRRCRKLNCAIFNQRKAENNFVENKNDLIRLVAMVFLRWIWLYMCDTLMECA